MLDIHPAHHAASTWRDFFIHIATITVGLLIAISLEQTVEAIHHAQERRTLIQALHEECRNNVETLDILGQGQRSRVLLLRTRIAALRDARPERGSISVTLPANQRTGARAHTPSRSVWAAAKASGKIAYLPENLSQVYDRVDWEAEQFESFQVARGTAAGKLFYFGIRTGQQIGPGETTLHLTLAQRDELEGLLGNFAIALESQYVWGLEWMGASHAVMDGVETRDAVLGYVDRAVAAGEIK